MEKALFTFLTLILLFRIYTLILLSQEFSSSSSSRSPILRKYISPFLNHKKFEIEIVPFDSISYEEEEQAMAPTVNDQDVVVLTTHNFSNFVAKNHFVMVDFYTSWCYFSKKLAPIYAEAATMLKSNNSKVVLAKVDCNQEMELAKMFKINGYPTLYFFIGGGVQKILCDFIEEWKVFAIVNWVNSKINNSVQNLITIEDAEHVLALKPVFVLGFLDSLEGPETEELNSVSKLHTDVNFYQTTNFYIAQLFRIDAKIKRPVLVLLKREDQDHIHTHFTHEGNFSKSAITKFVSIYKAPSVIKFTIDNAGDIFENPIKQLWLFTPGESCDVLYDLPEEKSACAVYLVFKDVANAFKGKILFVYGDNMHSDTISEHLAYDFRLDGNAPKVVAYYNTSEGYKKHIYNGELSLNGIKSFAEVFLQGKFRDISKNNTVLRLPSDSNISTPSSLPRIY